ncbi:MAG: hypothetical protein V2I33_05065 [Kangiellaceae bacterium]|jgi:hypothetical protein|nr:hypothetical protein [Kangiellaceae bacterium]
MLTRSPVIKRFEYHKIFNLDLLARIDNRRNEAMPMKQFARLVGLWVIMVLAGFTNNVEATEYSEHDFKVALEVHMTRMKAEALVEFNYQLKQTLKQPKTLFLGVMAKPNEQFARSQQTQNGLNSELAVVAD